MSNYTLYRQDDVLDLVRARLGDERDERWTKRAKYRALNYALRELPVRYLPSYYTLSFTTGEASATLPSYVDGPVEPQYKASTGTTWKEIAHWRVDDDLDGARTLVLAFAPTSSEDVRVKFYSQPGVLPEVNDICTLNADITSSATSLVLSSSPVVGEVGFVQIGGEWIGYVGGSSDASNLTLSNLDRGLYSTSAAAHSADDYVYFGIPILSTDVLNYIVLAAGVWLHSTFISSPHGHNVDMNGMAVNLLREERDRAWRRISAMPKGRIQLNPAGII